MRAYRDRFEDDLHRGDEPVLLFFFSGHGSRDPGKPAALAMLDGALTQRILYEEVLAALPARFVHLLVDACHAEAVVRPRDLSAQTVEVSEEDVRGLAAKTTLDRFPNVGAVVAAASAAQAHEWDLYQRGVFTHEMLSGLRGAADVNGDGRVEYSELSAFLAAANRDIPDARARADIVVRAPTLDRRAAILDLSRLRANARLVGTAESLGLFWIEDARGNRLADAHAEAGFRVGIALPRGSLSFCGPLAGKPSFTCAAAAASPSKVWRSARRRRARAERWIPLFVAGSLRARSALSTTAASSIRTGPTSSPSLRTRRAPPATAFGWSDPGPRPSWTPGWLVTSLGAAAAIGAGVFTGLAVQAQGDLSAAQFERPASDARQRFETDRDVAIGLGAAAVVGLGVGTVMLLRSMR